MKKLIALLFIGMSLISKGQNIATTSATTILTNDVSTHITGTAYQTRRISYTVTAADTVQGFSVIGILFTTAFADTNYTVSFSLDYYKALSADCIVTQGPITGKTKNGINAIMYMPIGIKRYVGQKVTVNVMALHD